MKLDDSIQLQKRIEGTDEQLNPTETTEWLELGRCKIIPNNSAAKISGHDGHDYSYSYTIFLRKPKSNIPRENDLVHITKKDGTIDKDIRVIGFVTLRNWLKLWLK